MTTSGINLSVAGTGWGNVSGAGLNCNLGSIGACNAELASGTAVTLTATAGPNTAFVSWSGQYSPTPALVVTIASLVPHNAVTGGGISCISGIGGVCRVDPATGSTVTLTAAPASGSTFVGFGGCTSTPTPTTCTVTLTQPTLVTARFNP